MNPKEERILLGELKEFKRVTLAESQSTNKRLQSIETKIDALNRFKWKVTGIMAGVVFTFEALFQAARAYFDFKKH